MNVLKKCLGRKVSGSDEVSGSEKCWNENVRSKKCSGLKISTTGRSPAEQVHGHGLEFREVDVEHHLRRPFTQAGAFTNRPAQRVPVACGETGVDVDQQ